MGDLREPNGAVLDELPVPCSSSLVGPEVWGRAEEATQEIIRQVQPTVVSEERRRDVIDYVQRLLKSCLGCEVFPFGSVPLKTYLPDGDIDLTAFCGLNFEENFANDVYLVLEAEDRNPTADFVVKDVQYIRAEVKLVKCLVQNIVVDISFNQIGGLCALCFLEEVDRLIGKDHLFKRSIILIKAWCYYESRILGAHHGLISTYALETLVLYIFHLFHSSLSGPLAVLYKFLDYFSKFDWENYCVSLSGPVHVSSLPEIVSERPENGGADLLLSDDFVSECVKKFSVPSRGTEANFRTFMQKHLNIVDPLKENNNLGRSVSKGNFFRIRSAFSYGARKLAQILLHPQENMTEEVRRFFTNTLDRHGQGQRPDVQDILLMPGCNGFAPEMLFSVSGAEPFHPEESYSHEIESATPSDQSGDCRVLDSEDTRHVRVDNNAGDPETHFEEQRSSKKLIASTTCGDEASSPSSSSRLSGDASDLATPGIRNLRMTNHKAQETNSPLGNMPHVPHLYFPPYLENGKMENGDLDQHQHQHQHHSSRSMPSEQENSHICNNMLQDSRSIYGNGHASRTVGSLDSMNRLLPDLSGDFDSHLGSLHYGRWWYDCDNFMATVPIQMPHTHPPPPPLFQRKNQWDAIRHSVPFRRDMVPHVNVNGVVTRPAFFPVNPPVVAAAAFGVDEMPKARGTGTYFPIMNHHSYRDRSSLAKGRTQGPLKSPRTNGRGPTPLDRSPQAQSPVRQGGKSRCPDLHEGSPKGKVFKEVNGFVHNPEIALVLPHPETPFPERDCSTPLDSSSSPVRSQNGESVFVVDDARLSIQYRLKDDDDFPPLST